MNAYIGGFSGRHRKHHKIHIPEVVDGEDAIAKFIEHKDKMALVLTDVIMPKKNGMEFYNTTSVIMPEMATLFMSDIWRM